MAIEDKAFLIIAGQPKAGTTSLFTWLARHAQITAAIAKEARFFLDADYPLPSAGRFNGQNLQDYGQLFPRPHGAVLLEASPDYLYNQTPLQIARLLPRARLVVIRREPVARMVSCYRYFQQRGDIAASMSFADYVRRQVPGEGVAAPVALRALEHCRAEHYLSRFRQAFGPRLLELEFEALRQAPREMLAQICAHAGLAPLDDSAPLTVQNSTQVARVQGLMRAYIRLRNHAVRKTLHRPGLRRVLAPASRAIRRLLVKKVAPPPTVVPEDIAALIREVAAR